MDYKTIMTTILCKITHLHEHKYYKKRIYYKKIYKKLYKLKKRKLIHSSVLPIKCYNLNTAEIIIKNINYVNKSVIAEHIIELMLNGWDFNIESADVQSKCIFYDNLEYIYNIVMLYVLTYHKSKTYNYKNVLYVIMQYYKYKMEILNKSTPLVNDLNNIIYNYSVPNQNDLLAYKIMLMYDNTELYSNMYFNTIYYLEQIS